MRRLAAFSVFVLIFFCAAANGEEWTRWLGPEGTGISRETGLLDQWPDGGPKQLWSAEVGEGFASPVALDGRIYLFGQTGRDDTLTALDAVTGKVLWKESNEARRPPQAAQGANSQNGLALPQATPTIDGDRIYTYGGGGELVCRNLRDGTQIWRVDVLAQTRGDILTWGQASSPLIVDKYIYVQAGEDGPTAVAVDKSTGQIAWKSEASQVAGYASIILAKVGPQPQLIVFGGDALFGMDPQTGKTLWTQPWEMDNHVNASTPIFRDNHLFISSAYGKGSAMFALSERGAVREWESKEIQSQFQPMTLDGDRLYANSGGTLKCVHWPDGKLLWSSRTLSLGSGGTFVLVGGDKMIALSDRGKLSLAAVDQAGLKLAGQKSLFDNSRIWSLPLVYHGKLYAKGKTELVCLDISAK